MAPPSQQSEAPLIAARGFLLLRAILLHRQNTDVDSFGKCLYAVYEAKKYSERVGSVGKKTTISILYPDGTASRLATPGYAAPKIQYKEFGPKDVPEKINIDPKFILEPD